MFDCAYPDQLTEAGCRPLGNTATCCVYGGTSVIPNKQVPSEDYLTWGNLEGSSIHKGSLVHTEEKINIK